MTPTLPIVAWADCGSNRVSKKKRPDWIHPEPLVPLSAAMKLIEQLSFDAAAERALRENAYAGNVTPTDHEIAMALDEVAGISERFRPTSYSSFEIKCFRAGYAAGERAKAIEIRDECGVQFDGQHDYVVLQMSRVTWDELRALPPSDV